jgi:hypothetical protein
VARVKVRLADNIARVVFLETDATAGATLGKNVRLPDGSVGTPATIRQWLGVSAGGSGGVVNHQLLQGLTIGDDHPQYLRKDTLTTQGDLYVRGATVPVRLAPGANGQFLKIVAGVPAWSTDLNVEEIVPGFGILVDDYDPERPIVSIDTTFFADVAFTGDYYDLIGTPADLSGLAFLTENDETALAPNSRRLAAGLNVTFDTATPGILTINATGGGGGYGGVVDGIVAGLGIDVDSSSPDFPIVSVDETEDFLWTGDHVWTEFAIFESGLDSEFGYLGIRNSGATGATNVWLYNTDHAAELKYWEIGTNTTSGGTADGTSLNLNFYTDLFVGKQAFRFIKNSSHVLTTIQLGNATDNPDMNLYSDLIRGLVGSYEWLAMESDGAAAVSGSYIDLKSDVYSEFLIRSYVNDDYGPTMTFYKARGTQAAPTQNLSGDQLGGFFWGSRHNSAGWHFPAAVDFTTTANTTIGGGAPGYLSLKVGPTFATLKELLRLTTAGLVELGTDTGLTIDEHASAPATPASGKVILYAKADGNLYQKDDAGLETSLVGVSKGAAWDGGGAAIVTPVTEVVVFFERTATIRSATLIADAVGSCVVDVRKKARTSLPASSGDSICASAKPTLSTNRTSRDTTLTGWTTAVAAGDTLTFVLESASGISALSIVLDCA